MSPIPRNLTTFGVLGGMGPGSTVSFLDRFVRILHQRTGATLNHEFPAITVQTVPAADYINDHDDLTQFLNQLRQAFNVFSCAAVDFVVVPCNTAHLYLPTMGDNNILILSLLKAVEKRQSFKKKRVLHLATEQTVSSDLYGDIFRKQAATVIVPNKADQQEIHSIIWSANAGVTYGETSLTKRLDVLISKYLADVVFLGCTELSLVREVGGEHSNIIDSLDILVDTTVDIVTGQKNLDDYLLC